MSSGTVDTNIESIVNDLQPVSWKQVLNEAITNSMQANGTKIKIKFIQNSLDLKDTKKYIDAIVVEDNGDGFNDINTKSFKEYKTQHKKELGCKGIGRFFYLKVFDKVDIQSLDKKIKFIISQDIHVEENLESKDNTIIKFNQPKTTFVVDYDKYKDELNDHFLAYFKLLKNEKKSIVIEVYENTNKKFEIKSDDIPEFKTRKFKINTHDFILDYILNDDSIKNYDGFYCAGGRVVIKNSYLDSSKKFRFFKNINILYLLSSNYLNNNVNETRDDFTIYPKQKNDDLFHNLSWSEIQAELKNQVKEIAKENNIDIDELSKANRKKALEEMPFLAYYLKDDENNDDYESLKRNAKKRLEDDKTFIRNNKDKIDDSYQEKLSIITQAELAEYIFDRQRIINTLKELTDDNALEKEIHNLFMKQNTTDIEENYKTNNLWLFDDRFMTYDKVFSEAQIKTMFPELIKNTKRPDILSLSVVSNTYTKEDITDIVIIELKRPDENIDPSGAETQLLRYSRYINDINQNSKIRIWTYAFLKFNGETEFDLDNRSYNKIPVQGEYPIYYRYYEKPNTIINFLDYRSMAHDANSRNKTFMKILNGETIKENEDNNK